MGIIMLSRNRKQSPVDKFWQGCQSDIKSFNGNFKYSDAEHEKECRKIAVDWWRESKKAGVYSQSKYASHTQSIDTSGIASLVVRGITVEREKRLVLLRMKTSVRGFDSYDSDKFIDFWTKDWEKPKSNEQSPRAPPVGNFSDTNFIPPCSLPTFVPPNLNLPPQVPSLPQEMHVSQPEPNIASDFPKAKSKIRVKKENEKERSAKFDVFIAEKDHPILKGKLKKNFNLETPADLTLESGIDYFQKCASVLEAYDKHHKDKFGVQPVWGKTLIESLFCPQSASRPYGTGLDNRIPNWFRFMIIWVLLDLNSAKLFWKSIKGLDPKKAKEATKIRDDGITKFETMLKKKKLKKSSVKIPFDRIFSRWYKKMSHLI